MGKLGTAEGDNEPGKADLSLTPSENLPGVKAVRGGSTAGFGIAA